MTTLIKIGNSQGIRLPKTIIEQAHLKNKNLVFEVLDNGLLIKPARENTRENWKANIEKVLSAHENENDDGLMRDFLNDSDLEDYEW